jgi:hypothetical protein
MNDAIIHTKQFHVAAMRLQIRAHTVESIDYSRFEVRGVKSVKQE